MKTFEKYTIEEFSRLIDHTLTSDMSFYEVSDIIDSDDDIRCFYMSMNPDDVLEAIENEQELADVLGLHLIEVEELDLFIATY